MLQAARTFVAGSLAIVMLATSVLSVVLVECRTAGHLAVEPVGHAAAATPCEVVAEHAAASCSQEDHHHEDCSDGALLDPITPQRPDQQQPTADTPVAVLAPIGPWSSALVIDSRSQPQLCPRPPPRLPKAVDAFLTHRLLI